MVRKFLERFKKALKGNRGYTLVEVVAVIAISATLAAVVVPIAVDKVKQGKIVAATQQVKQIGTAISGFVKDTGIFPTRGTGGQDRTVDILWSGSIAHWVDVPNDATTGTTWPTATSTDPVSALRNHLIFDGGTGTDAGIGRYAGAAAAPNGDGKVDWKGPYLDEVGTDPWGRPYLVLSKAFSPAGGNDPNVAPAEYGWILSAGINGKIDTCAKGSVLNDRDCDGKVDDEADDLGMVLYRYQPLQTGAQ